MKLKQTIIIKFICALKDIYDFIVEPNIYDYYCYEIITVILSAFKIKITHKNSQITSIYGDLSVFIHRKSPLIKNLKQFRKKRTIDSNISFYQYLMFADNHLDVIIAPFSLVHNIIKQTFLENLIDIFGQFSLNTKHLKQGILYENCLVNEVYQISSEYILFNYQKYKKQKNIKIEQIFIPKLWQNHYLKINIHPRVNQFLFSVFLNSKNKNDETKLLFTIGKRSHKYYKNLLLNLLNIKQYCQLNNYVKQLLKICPNLSHVDQIYYLEQSFLRLLIETNIFEKQPSKNQKNLILSTSFLKYLKNLKIKKMNQEQKKYQIKQIDKKEIVNIVRKSCDFTFVYYSIQCNSTLKESTQLLIDVIVLLYSLKRKQQSKLEQFSLILKSSCLEILMKSKNNKQLTQQKQQNIQQILKIIKNSEGKQILFHNIQINIQHLKIKDKCYPLYQILEGKRPQHQHLKYNINLHSKQNSKKSIKNNTYFYLSLVYGPILNLNWQLLILCSQLTSYFLSRFSFKTITNINQLNSYVRSLYELNKLRYNIYYADETQQIKIEQKLNSIKQLILQSHFIHQQLTSPASKRNIQRKHNIRQSRPVLNFEDEEYDYLNGKQRKR